MEPERENQAVVQLYHQVLGDQWQSGWGLAPVLANSEIESGMRMLAVPEAERPGLLLGVKVLVGSIRAEVAKGAQENATTTDRPGGRR